MFHSFPSTSSTKYGLPLNLNYRKTFTTLRYGILTILFQHAKTLINGEYRPVHNAHFVLTPKRYSMLSLDVNLTLIALLGRTIQFLIFSRRLYNLEAVLTCSLIYLVSKTPQLLLVTPFVQICYWHPQINHCCTLSSSLLAMSSIFIKTLYGRRTLIRQQKQYYNEVKFINISLSSLGVFAKECDTFLGMLDNFGFDDPHKLYCVRNMMKIAIRTSYYIYLLPPK